MLGIFYSVECTFCTIFNAINIDMEIRFDNAFQRRWILIYNLTWESRQFFPFKLNERSILMEFELWQWQFSNVTISWFRFIFLCFIQLVHVCIHHVCQLLRCFSFQGPVMIHEIISYLYENRLCIWYHFIPSLDSTNPFQAHATTPTVMANIFSVLKCMI